MEPSPSEDREQGQSKYSDSRVQPRAFRSKKGRSRIDRSRLCAYAAKPESETRGTVSERSGAHECHGSVYGSTDAVMSMGSSEAEDYGVGGEAAAGIAMSSDMRALRVLYKSMSDSGDTPTSNIGRSSSWAVRYSTLGSSMPLQAIREGIEKARSESDSILRSFVEGIDEVAASGYIDGPIYSDSRAGLAEEIGTGPVERQRRPVDLEEGRAEECDLRQRLERGSDEQCAEGT